MRYNDAIFAALGAIRVNMLRSALTALGIIIGVAAVIVMISVGAGAQKRVDDFIKTLGANLVLVVPGTTTSGGARGARGSRPTITEDDAIAIQTQVRSVRVAAPMVRGTGQLVLGNKNWSTSLFGVTPEFQEAREWTLRQGRWFSHQEVRAAAKVAVVGETILENLFAAGEDPIGRIIRVKRVPFRIVGTLQPKGETPHGHDMDDSVFVPISTAKKRLIGGRRLSGRLVSILYVKSENAGVVADTVRDMTSLLRQRHRIRPGQNDDFYVRNLSSIMEARANSSAVMTLLMAAVASISLIVGGIGIMNIMLVSVTERTREIGVRMAVGARSMDVISQFLLEAVLISALGGVLGIGAGILAVPLAASLNGGVALLAPASIPIAFMVAVITGVAFGLYPAVRASQLDPIDALRHE